MSWIKTRCWGPFLGRTRLLAAWGHGGPYPEVESGQSTRTATTVLGLLISAGLPLLLPFWDFLLTSTSPSLGVYLLLPLALPVGVTQIPSSSRTLSPWLPCSSEAVLKYCCTSLFSAWTGQGITRSHPSVSPGWQVCSLLPPLCDSSPASSSSGSITSRMEVTYFLSHRSISTKNPKWWCHTQILKLNGILAVSPGKSFPHFGHQVL